MFYLPVSVLYYCITAKFGETNNWLLEYFDVHVVHISEKHFIQLGLLSWLPERLFWFYFQYSQNCSDFQAEMIKFHCPLGVSVSIAVSFMFVNRWSSMLKTFLISLLSIGDKKYHKSYQETYINIYKRYLN